MKKETFIMVVSLYQYIVLDIFYFLLSVVQGQFKGNVVVVVQDQCVARLYLLAQLQEQIQALRQKLVVLSGGFFVRHNRTLHVHRYVFKDELGQNVGRALGRL